MLAVVDHLPDLMCYLKYRTLKEKSDKLWAIYERSNQLNPAGQYRPSYDALKQHFMEQTERYLKVANKLQTQEKMNGSNKV